MEEYLYDKTENYFERLTIRAQPWRDVWARVYAYSGERLFLFIDVVGSGLCQTSTVWGYIITDKDYLVPLTDHYSEAMNEYGGRKRKDYQKKVTKAWEEYDTKMNFEAVIYQNILEFCEKNDWKKERTAYYMIKEEKDKKRIQLSCFFLQRAFDTWEEYLDEEWEGIMELELKKEGTEYKVLSRRAIWKEEVETELETKLLWVTKSDLESVGYPSDEITEELRIEMGEKGWKRSLFHEKLEVYELFSVWHDKLEERKQKALEKDKSKK